MVAEVALLPRSEVPGVAQQREKLNGKGKR